jgi:hypothetical protein
MDAACVAVNGGELESLTWTVNGKVPAVVGVPLTVPVEAEMPRPGGRVPEADHV